ncbi:MAG TPA: Calx-beta domain-containing protein [Pyrinomonadaceae bacterium]|nr:Calx-beta domain-containing protein [Pyrinomonadaceae bacterium]
MKTLRSARVFFLTFIVIISILAIGTGANAAGLSFFDSVAALFKWQPAPPAAATVEQQALPVPQPTLEPTADDVIHGEPAPVANAVSTGTYPFTFATGVSLEDMSSGTTTISLAGADLDDGVSSALSNIGFDFWYDGTRYAQFGVSANGYVRLGSIPAASSPWVNETIFPSTTDAPKIAPFYDDLCVGANGKIHSKTIGTAPNRKLVLEYQNMQITRGAGCSGDGGGTFQMWLSETTGVIEFVYGAGMTGSLDGGYTIGMQSGSATNYVSVTTAVPTSSGPPAESSQANAIASGTKYIFTPNAPTAAPSNLTFTAITGGGMTLNWTDNSSNELGFAIYRSTDGVNYSYINQTAAGATSSAQSGLGAGTTYFWKVFAVTEGALGSALSGSQATTPGATYTWNQTGSAAFGTASNWTPTRTTPASSDILVFNNGATTTVTGVATQTIGQLKISGNTNVSLQATTTAKTLTISGGGGDDLDIAAGSTLQLNSATVVNIAFSGGGHSGNIAGTMSLTSAANTFSATNSVTTVSGTINNTTGTITGSAATLQFAGGANYNHLFTTSGGTIPTATWNAASNVNITALTSATSISGAGQAFGNLTWNCAAQTGNLSLAGTAITAAGTFTVTSTGTGTLRMGAGTNGTITAGNFTQTGGTLDLSSGSGSGTLRVSGTFNHSAGTLTETGTGTANTIEFNGSTNQSVTPGTISNTVSYRINNSAGVAVTGTLAIPTGASMIISSGGTPITSGSVSYTGTTTLVYNSATAAQTATSSEFLSAAGATNLTINNTAAAPNNTVTLPFSRSISGTLTLTAGLLSNGNNLFTVTGTTAASVSAGSATSYVNGQLARVLPASLATGSTYGFPVGKSAFSKVELVNPTTNAGGTVTVLAEAFDANSGGTAGAGLGSLNTNRYWQTQIISGAGNFTNTTIRFTETGVISANKIGASASQTGAYDSIGGTVAGSTILSNAITSLNFFAIGTGGFPGGAYSVGSGGDYATLTAAITAVNGGVLSGPVVLNLTDATYPSETFPLTINANPGSSATNTITIKPAAGVSPVIFGSASSCIIKLSGADYVTIDGSNNGSSSRDLSITNNSTNNNSAAVCFSSLGAGAGATNDTIKNTVLRAGALINTSFGVVLAGNTNGVSGADNDSITIQNNDIAKARFGIAVSGTASSSAGGVDGLLITNNIVGPVTAGSNNISFIGISLQNAVSPNATGNTVRNVISGNSGVAGISFNDGVSNGTIAGSNITNISSSAPASVVAIADGFTGTTNTGTQVTGNTISNVSATATSPSFNGAQGIISGTPGARISGNTISGISNAAVNGWPALGIEIDTELASSNITIANNAIYDIQSYSATSTFATFAAPAGIYLQGSTGGINIYYNSINLSGSHAGNGDPNNFQAALSVGPDITGLDVRNNIFANSYDNPSAAPEKSYAIYSEAPASAYTNINYNDYYASGPNAVLGFIGGADVTSLANWKTATGKDANSIAVDPIFAGDADLRLIAGSPALAAGTPIAGITTDITGAARSASTPSIGAYENGLIAPGNVQFNSAAYSGLEGQNVLVTVSRVAGASGAISVDYATSTGGSAGTATAGVCGSGSDYTDINGTLSWADGDHAPKTFSVQTCSDGLSPESIETVSLTLSNPIGTTIIGTNPATLNINDNPPGTLQFNAAAYSGNEGQNVVVTVARAGGSYGAVSVDYATGGGTAVGGASCAGSDYVTTAGTLSWADGDAVSKTFNVQLCGDGLIGESTETLNLTLSNSTGTTISGTNPAVLSIINDPINGTIFSNNTGINILDQGQSSLYPSQITVSGMTGSISSMSVTLNNLSHTYPADIVMQLVGPQGQQYFFLANVGGNIATSNVTLQLFDSAPSLLTSALLTSGQFKPTDQGISNLPTPPAPQGPYFHAAPAGTDTFASVFNGTNPNGVWSLYIYDQFNPDGGALAGGWDLDISTSVPVHFSAPSYITTENAGSVTLTVTRDGTGSASAVDYATGGGISLFPAVGGAVCGAGVDYVNTAGTLNFAIGEASRTFDIPLCDDAVYDGLKTINVALSNPTAGTSLGNLSETTVFVNDDEPAPTLSIGDVTVNEGDGTATFVVTQSFAAITDTNFMYTTSDLTAAAGSDYTGATNTIATVTAGTTTTNIVIPILQDGGFEDAETFRVAIFNATNATVVNTFGTGTIIDDDVPAQYTVTSTNNVNDGNCNATHCSLREAMNASNAAPGIISFAPGLTGTITLTGSRPQITNNTVINGPGANVITVSGNNLITPFDIPNASTSVTIKGITITNGRNLNSGQAGAITNGGDLTILDSVITASRGSIAGAIQNYTKLTVRNSTISNNIGGTTDPACANVAGAINMSGGTATITNSTISGNSVSTNCSANSGAINIYAGAVTLNHSTVTNNSSSDNSAAITNTDVTPVKTFNSIIAGNHSNTAGPDVGGQFESQGFNLIGNVDNSSGFNLPTDQTGTGASPINPMLGALANNGGTMPTHALLSGSPAKDQGNSFGVTTDQRGVARPINDLAIADVSGGDGGDIGAYEVSNPVIQVTGGPLTFPDTVVGAFSAEQAFTVNGSGLEGSITVTAPADFQISAASGSGFGPSVTLPQTSGFVINEQVYVRFAPASEGAKSGNVANSAASAITQNVAVSGNAIHEVHYGALQFSSAAYSSSETNADHTINIVVDRTGGSDGAVSVDYAVTDDTATVADNDYSITPASGTLNWADGDAAAKNIVIIVKGDLTVEPDETVNFALSNTAGGAALGSPSSAVLTITNDDAPPAIYVVNVNDDTNDGACDVTHCSLREAIIAVNAQAGEINFAPNVTGEIDLLSALPIINSPFVTINGPGAAVLTVRPAESVPNNRIFAIGGSGTMTVSGLRFYAGIGSGAGGAIYNFGTGSLTVNNCVFDANTGGFSGGAINHSSPGALNISGSSFNSNTANSGVGGAISIAFNPTVAIANSTFAGNSAGTGGTISVEEGNVTFTNCAINGANATFQGAGIYYGGVGTLSVIDSTITSAFAGNSGGALFNLSTGTVNVTRSTLSGNSATTAAGGIYNNSGTVTITDSTISGNTATGGSSNGAGLLNNSTGTYNVTNTTISGNSANGASGTGGGIYFTQLGAGQGTFTSCTITSNSARNAGGILVESPQTVILQNTLVAGNTNGSGGFGPDVWGPVFSGGYNLIGNNQAATITPITGDQIGTPGTPINPQLGPLQDNGGPTFTHALLTGSPAIDKGSAFSLTTDQRGLTRPSNKLTIANEDDGSDIGAFELQAPPTPSISVDDTVFVGDTLVPNVFTVTLSNANDLAVTVHYATADDSAHAGEDYTAKSGTLIFNPGETSKTIPVNVLPNTTNEATEQFFLNLDMPVNGTIADGQGIGTIFDDDPQATMAIDDVTHTEGNSGVTTYTFTVTKTGTTAQTISVDYATVNASAVAPSDFGSVSGTLTFTPAETTKTISVDVNGDTNFESDEIFYLRLTNPVAVDITRGEGIGTITNDDNPTLYLVNVNDDTDDGICDVTNCTLREAINWANSTGGHINFAPNVTGNISLLSNLPPLVNGNAIVINGPGANVLTVKRDASVGTLRHFTVSGTGNYTISGLTIADGDSRGFGGLNAFGGAIKIDNSRGVTINNCVFTNNWANNGGAIANDALGTSSPLTVNNSTFTANNAAQSGGGIYSRRTNVLTVNSGTFNANGAPNFGGGIYTGNTSVAFITDSLFTGNAANSGAGIYNDDNGSVTINRCNFISNNAAVGAAVNNKNGGMDVFNSTLSGNTASSEGGAAYNQFGTLNFFNSTLSGNTSGSIGGAIYYTFQGASNGTISNCTITGNHAPNGGGVMIWNGQSVVRIRNSILAGNTGSQGPDLYGTIYSSGYNILGTLGGSWGHMDPAPGDQIGQFSIINPMLAPLADNGGPTRTHLPLPGSPAINAGNAFGETADQRGFARTVNGVTDIGAVEIQNSPTQISAFSGTPQSATIGTNYAPLKARVLDTNNDPVGGVSVTFNAPNTGASGTFPGSVFSATAVTDGNGVATAPVFTANNTAGSFQVSAGYAASPLATFDLTNLNALTISVDDVTFTGADSLAASGFTVTLSAAGAQTITVHYQTADGTAVAGEDYTAASGTLTFDPGETSKPVPVTILPDAVQESTEQFYLNLDSPSSNAVIADAQGVGTIPNDDAAPTFAIDDVTQSEGNSGTTLFTFTITRTGSTALGSTVNYTTGNGTAAAGSDYDTASGSVNFLPNETSKQVIVSVNGDATYENDETFTVDLTSTDNGTFTDNSGLGTITNDDAAPAFSINHIEFAEGNSGTTAFNFIVTKTGSTDLNAGVNFETNDSSAQAPEDFTALSGMLNFLPGEMSKTITVNVNGDTAFETNEAFSVRLSGPANATLTNDTGVGTIDNDDTAPSFSIDDVTHDEGNSGTTSYTFTVTKTGSTALDASVNYNTVDGNASVADGDYTNNSGTVTFLPGDTTQTITILVNGDTKFESNEKFSVQLTDPANAAISDQFGDGYITNDDAAPSFSIDDVTHSEGNTGTVSYTFTVTKTGETDTTALVDFEAQDGTATIADNDYQSNAGTLTFQTAETTKTITVLVNGNYLIEPDEAFTVHLSNPNSATISDADGTGTIANDDNPPAVTYVDDDWAALSNGTDPDGAGPALAIGYDSFDKIQEGIDAVMDSGTVNVYGGTYDEDVTVTKAGMQLLGAGAGSTNIRGPIGGSSTTVQIAASNMTIAGFTITRLGNNTTDWNNPNLNNAGVAIQGQSITGAVIHDNILTGNRTAIDINNSNGHTVRNNVIDFNRQGLIFRNQTDNLTVVENFITNNWNVGVTFLDGSGGTNSPVQSAANSIFSKNNISANWYAQIVDRQTGGSLPAPNTTNLKNFKGNWFGTMVPVTTTANSAEPGYAAQIPVAFGGTATAPGGQPDIAGPASANFKYEPQLLSGTDTNVETVPGRGTFGFQGVANVPIVNIQDQTFIGADSLGASQGFTVTLTGDSSQIVTVHYQTADGTAVAGEDYTAASGTLTFNPGEISKVIPITILGDSVQEPTEQFSIDLDTPVNGAILDGHAVGTIPNDDAGPAFSIDDVSHNEGNSGTTAFTFIITKTGGTALTSNVTFTTQDGSAASPGDYSGVSGNVIFGPSDTTKQVTVQVNGDIELESSETFTLHLSGTDNGTISDADGTGTIVNDDAAATVQFGAAAYSEDESQTAVISVTRTGDTTGTTTVDLATSNGTAVGGASCTTGVDFINTSAVITFAPTETSRTANVQICTDSFRENPEALNLTLSNAGAPAVLGTQSTAALNINDTASQFRSVDPIAIGNNVQANPYPSTINVAGAPAVSSSVRVTLYDITHNSPEDLDILLVSPAGQKFILMGNAGGGVPLNAVTLTFDDTAFQVLPNFTQVVTGKYEPTNWVTPVANFVSPAPVGPYTEPGSAVGGFSLRNTFGSFNPNGGWNLYVRDRGSVPPLAPEGVGAIAGGWGLEFVAPTAATAEISGRVLTADGRPIANVKVVLSGGGSPSAKVVYTGQLGYYYFSDLPVGQNYVVTVKSRRFNFADPTRLFTLVDNITDENFVAEPQE